MTLSRSVIADEIDRIDGEIADMQGDKAQIFAAYREQLEGQGIAKSAIKVEIAALKAAIRERRALREDCAATEERDALADEILAEIMRPKSGTPDATRARAPRASGIPDFLRVENRDKPLTANSDTSEVPLS